MLYHQYAESRLKGALLRFKAYISRVTHRVTLFIGLRGSLADDRTARMLHVLLVSLAVWMAAAWLATIPFAPKSFPRIFNTVVLVACYATGLVLLRLGHFRRASLAYLAGTWIWATLVSSFFGGVRSPGSTALRVLASLGGLAPRIYSRHMDSGRVSAQCAGIYGSGDDACESSAPKGNATGNLGHHRTSRLDQRHPGGTDHRQASGDA
jgi:hypothetical protein